MFTVLFLSAYIIQCNNVNACKRSVFWDRCTYYYVLLYPNAGCHSFYLLILCRVLAYIKLSQNLDTDVGHMGFDLTYT
jgi:hypothetical protein